MRSVVHAVVAMVVAAGVAQAQPAPSDELARQYTAAAIAAQEAKDFDTAITMFQKAYDRVPHPVLLFNLGLTYKEAGRLDQARELLRRYLERDPEGSEVAVARTLLEEIDAALAREAKAPEAARPAPPVRPETPARPQARGAGRGLRTGGMVAGGAGLAGAGAAIVFARRGARLSDELSTPGATFDPDKVRAGEAANRYAIGFAIAGGALVAGGAVMYWLGHRERAAAERRLAWVPIVGEGVAGIALAGAVR